MYRNIEVSAYRVSSPCSQLTVSLCGYETELRMGHLESIWSVLSYTLVPYATNLSKDHRSYALQI